MKCTRFGKRANFGFIRTVRSVHELFLNKQLTASVFGNSRANYSIINGGNLKITVAAIMNRWKTEFGERNVPEPDESVKYILGHILGVKEITKLCMQKDRVLKSEEIKRINELCEKRLHRMPVQYIIQEWDFRDLTLKMSPPVFIPRPETETLVDIVLDAVDSKGARNILEFCCGSGAISLALLKARSQLHLTAVDKSKQACQLTKENAHTHGLSNRIKIIHANITNNFNHLVDFDSKFEIIVSNPPYVPSADITYLQPEITRYEDLDALDGGGDGLNLIKSILRVAAPLLDNRGSLFLEVDPSHPALIKTWLEINKSSGLKFIRAHKDFCEKERFVEINKIA